MNSMLEGLLAGLAAAVAGFFINNRLLERMGDKALIVYIPLAEETAKTAAALLLGANILLTHMVFGVVEALYDLYNSPPAHSCTASVLGLISHTLLGLTAHFTLRVFGSRILAVLVPAVLHSLWNRIMTGYTG